MSTLKYVDVSACFHALAQKNIKSLVFYENIAQKPYKHRHKYFVNAEFGGVII